MNYSDTVERVMSLLKEKKVCSSSQKSHRDCYESLGSYLKQNNTGYTVKARDEWFTEIKKSLPSQRCVIWLRYVYQLEELDSSGTVSDCRLYLNQSTYNKLPISWKDDLDFYLKDCSECVYWYIYKFCVIICIKINSSFLQELYLYERGELLMNQRKLLKELNLLDKFLFDEAMDDPENVKIMLDIILSQKTKLKHPPQTEKEQRTSADNRQIRLDVYAIAENDVIYEVEAQKENTHNLPKRSRLYQGIIDSKLLPPGVVDFNLLNEVLIVLIMPFDLFGYGLYRYTFLMRCEEVPELKLDDGATRIFLNTRGKHPELVSPELIELLKYMEHSTDEVSGACGSKRIQEMHRRICQIKASEKTEVKYMQSWEEKIFIKQEGIAEGKQIGRLKEKTDFVKKLSNKFSTEQIAEMLEIDISEVENMIKEFAK